MQVGDLQGKHKLGVISADPLRVLGLQTVLGDQFEFQLIDPGSPGSLQTDSMEIIVVDSSATEHLLPLIEAFTRDMPQLRLLITGAETDFAHIEKVIGAGAKGYLAYSANEAEVRMAVEIVQAGSVWAPRLVMARLVERGHRRQTTLKAPAPPKLTQRERDVLRLLIAGQPNREIAAALGVDESTVKAHLGRLMRKAGVDNRTALTMKAIEQKLF